MWESPIYKIRKTIIDHLGDVVEEKDIVVDVTRSAPPTPKTGGYLEGVFKVLTAGKDPRKTKILDVGAAKLRNTLHLLEKGFKVYSVDFKEVYEKDQAKTNLNLAKKYKNFKSLVYPKDFFELKEKMDVILLIDVINVMPIPEERLVLLSLCREKMKKDGLLLCYNLRDRASYPKKYTEDKKLNDGWFFGKGRKHKTFKSEWPKDHVCEMLILSGFSLNRDMRLGKVGRNQAFVFNPDQILLLDKYLRLQEIKSGGKKRDPNVIIPETEKLYFPDLYVKELKNIRAGREEAAKFHRVSARLLATIFEHQLKKPIIEKEIFGGRARIDIRFWNKNEPGFFKNLKEESDVLCPTIPVECKNYNKDPKNPEFDQLSGRLSKIKGKFGMLVCRKISNKKKTIKHCHDKLEKDEYIIVLDDKDMENLANTKKEASNKAIDEKTKKEKSNKAIDDYMENKLSEIID